MIIHNILNNLKPPFNVLYLNTKFTNKEIPYGINGITQLIKKLVIATNMYIDGSLLILK